MPREKYKQTKKHKKNCNPNNLINLCISCNIKINFNREFWTGYFKEMVA